jgi:hypothetical protein
MAAIIIAENNVEAKFVIIIMMMKAQYWKLIMTLISFLNTKNMIININLYSFKID